MRFGSRLPNFEPRWQQVANCCVDLTPQSGLDDRWRASGYHPIIHFMEVPSADFAVQRVTARVAAGGHDIPEADIRRRFERGLKLFLARPAPGKPGRGRNAHRDLRRRARHRLGAKDRGLPAGWREELTRALFAPALSTRAEVSETSGRGVGLEAVRAEIDRLGGSIDVESEPGSGCRFVVRVPTDVFRGLRRPPESERRPSRAPSGVELDEPARTSTPRR